MDDTDRLGFKKSTADEDRQSAAMDWAKVRNERMMQMPDGGESTWTKMLQAVKGVPSELYLDYYEGKNPIYANDPKNRGGLNDDRRDDIYNKVYNARAKGMEPLPEHQEAWTRLLHSGQY